VRNIKSYREPRGKGVCFLFGFPRPSKRRGHRRGEGSGGKNFVSRERCFPKGATHGGAWGGREEGANKSMGRQQKRGFATTRGTKRREVEDRGLSLRGTSKKRENSSRRGKKENIEPICCGRGI